MIKQYLHTLILGSKKGSDQKQAQGQSLQEIQTPEILSKSKAVRQKGGGNSGQRGRDKFLINNGGSVIGTHSHQTPPLSVLGPQVNTGNNNKASSGNKNTFNINYYSSKVSEFQRTR